MTESVSSVPARPPSRAGDQERRRRGSPLHFRRIELKYVIPGRQVPGLVARLSPYVDWDPFVADKECKTYPVTSLYFDSFNLQSLFEKEAGWLSRRRVRLRTYHDTFDVGATMFFEIKRRHDFLVSKDRFPLSLAETDERFVMRGSMRRLLAIAREGDPEAAEEIALLDAWYNLQPSVIVGYDRLAFVAKSDPELRITIDSHLRGCWRPTSLAGGHRFRRCGFDPVLPRLMSYGTHQARGPSTLSAMGYVVLELKFAHGIPRWLHDIIVTENLARSAYSKYAFVARDLRPNLFEAFEGDE